MPDEKFTIRVETIGDPKGANDVRGAVEGVTQAGVKDAAAMGEQTEKTNFLNLKKQQLTKLVRQLSQAFPELGMAIRLAMNPVVAILALAIGFFVKMKKSIEETNKSLDAMAAKAMESWGNMGSAVEEAKRAIANGSDEMSKHIKDISEAEKTLKEKADDATAALRRQEQQQIALSNAKEALELAEVDVQRKLHQVDPKKGLDDVAALKKEMEIKGRHGNERINIQTAADQGEINKKQQLRDNEELNRHEAEKSFNALGKNRVQRDASIKNLPKVVSKYDADITDNRAEKEKADKALQERQSKLESLKAFPLAQEKDIKGSQSRVDEAQAKVDDLNKQHDLLVRGKRQAEDKLAQLQLEAKNYDDAKTAMEKSADAVKALTRELNNLRQAADETAKFRRTEAGLHQAAESKKTAGAIIDATKGQTAPGTLPAGVIVDKKTGEVLTDPKTMPGYVPPPPATYTFPKAPPPTPEMAPEDIERLGGNSADVTRAHRAADQAAAHAREVAKQGGAAAKGIADIGQTIVNIASDVLNSNKGINVEVEKLKRQMIELQGQLKTSKSYHGG
ncbi:MAG: hypothetical protein JWQ71_3741 [Pedosphaera sp.]|nr:hypothetical protein [Pedosphaera sp.]